MVVINIKLWKSPILWDTFNHYKIFPVISRHTLRAVELKSRGMGSIKSVVRHYETHFLMPHVRVYRVLESLSRETESTQATKASKLIRR